MLDDRMKNEAIIGAETGIIESIASWLFVICAIEVAAGVVAPKLPVGFTHKSILSFALFAVSMLYRTTTNTVSPGANVPGAKVAVPPAVWLPIWYALAALRCSRSAPWCRPIVLGPGIEKLLKPAIACPPVALAKSPVGTCNWRE